MSNPPPADCKYRIMNIECRSNVFCLFYKKRLSEANPSFDIRYLQSAGGGFDILRFCGSLLMKFHTRCQGFRRGRNSTAAGLDIFLVEFGPSGV